MWGGGGGGLYSCEKRQFRKCLRQTIPNRWGNKRAQSFAEWLNCVYTRGDKGMGVGCNLISQVQVSLFL